MNCRFAREMIALWVGNDLTQAEAEAVSEHVNECPDCQQHVEAMMSCSDVLETIKSATVKSRHDSVWPEIEARLTKPGSGFSERQSRSVLHSVGMLSVAALTFAVAILPDYVPRRPVTEQFFSGISVSDVSTNSVSTSPERQQRLPRNFVPVYLDPSWQILDGLKDEPASHQHSGRRGSL